MWSAASPFPADFLLHSVAAVFGVSGGVQGGDRAKGAGRSSLAGTGRCLKLTLCLVGTFVSFSEALTPIKLQLLQ